MTRRKKSNRMDIYIVCARARVVSIYRYTVPITTCTLAHCGDALDYNMCTARVSLQYKLIQDPSLYCIASARHNAMECKDHMSSLHAWPASTVCAKRHSTKARVHILCDNYELETITTKIHNNIKTTVIIISAFFLGKTFALSYHNMPMAVVNSYLSFIL